MNAFIVELVNRPGELARATEAIAARGINLIGFSGATCGDAGSLVVITNDDEGTRRALREAGFTAREVELVPATIADAPGALAAAARRLANAGVNIEAALPTGMSADGVVVAFAVDDPARARAALGEGVVTGA